MLAGTAAAGGGVLGAAAGPLGLAATATALAGGALESGGRWVAGQAATGGGVLGDVDAPHVPSAPISRMGYHGTRPNQPTGAQPTTVGGAATSPPTRINIVQLLPDPPARAARPDSGSHLIIPGTVVPERSAALELPRRSAGAAVEGRRS